MSGICAVWGILSYRPSFLSSAYAVYESAGFIPFFAAHRSVDTLYAAWTVSWLATAAIHYICILFVRRRAIAKSNAGPAIKIVLQRKPKCDMINNEMIRKGGGKR